MTQSDSRMEAQAQGLVMEVGDGQECPRGAEEDWTQGSCF